MNGIDVSTYQGKIDFAQVKIYAGFVYAKATEGATYVDDQFRANHDGCKAAGIPFAPYHFFHFGQDPVAQAAHFLATIDGYEGTLLPMVDVESGGQDGVTNLPTLITGLSMFLTAIEKTLGGKRCIIYSDYGDWNGLMQGTDAFSGHPFWVAEYNAQPAPSLPAGFTSWVIWQYSSGGKVPGITGAVDLDRLNGNDLGIIER